MKIWNMKIYKKVDQILKYMAFLNLNIHGNFKICINIGFLTKFLWFLGKNHFLQKKIQIFYNFMKF